MIEVTADSDVKFTYSHITSQGSVIITEARVSFFEVRFQYRHATEDIQELLGTYGTLEEAVIAVSNGLTKQPDLDASLAELDISSDLFDWDRHIAGIRK